MTFQIHALEPPRRISAGATLIAAVESIESKLDRVMLEISSIPTARHELKTYDYIARHV